MLIFPTKATKIYKNGKARKIAQGKLWSIIKKQKKSCKPQSWGWLHRKAQEVFYLSHPTPYDRVAQCQAGPWKGIAPRGRRRVGEPQETSLLWKFAVFATWDSHRLHQCWSQLMELSKAPVSNISPPRLELSLWWDMSPEAPVAIPYGSPGSRCRNTITI